MGFSLHGYLVSQPEPVALYGRLFPAALRFTRRVPVEGAGPPGWLLPRPFGASLGDAADEARAEELESLFEAWAERPEVLGMPGEGIEHPFAVAADWGLCAWLSLADRRGVVDVLDETHAGLLIHEHATAWRAGRFVAAAGVGTRGETYAVGTRPRGETPVAWCAAHLDEGFAGRFLYDGYFPRGLGRSLTERPERLPERVAVAWPAGWPEGLRAVLEPQARRPPARGAA